MPSGPEQRFNEAKQLFAEGRYADALAILQALDAAYPNDRHLLHPMALCLARLGRTDEARALCERIVRDFDDPKARALLRELDAPAVVPAIPGLQPIDLGDLGVPPVVYTPPPPTPLWKKVLMGAGAVAGVLIVLGTVALVVAGLADEETGPGARPQQAQEYVPPAERFTRITVPERPSFGYVAVTILGFLLHPLVLYGALWLFEKLPYGELWRDLGHVTLVSYGVALFTHLGLSFAPCCAWPVVLIVAVVAVKRTYRLETGQVLFWYAGAILLNMLINFLQYQAVYG